MYKSLSADAISGRDYRKLVGCQRNKLERDRAIIIILSIIYVYDLQVSIDMRTIHARTETQAISSQTCMPHIVFIH